MISGITQHNKADNFCSVGVCLLNNSIKDEIVGTIANSTMRTHKITCNHFIVHISHIIFASI